MFVAGLGTAFIWLSDAGIRFSPGELVGKVATRIIMGSVAFLCNVTEPTT